MAPGIATSTDAFADVLGSRRGPDDGIHLDSYRPATRAYAALEGELAQVAAGRLAGPLAACRTSRRGAPLVRQLTQAMAAKLAEDAVAAHPGHELIARLSLNSALTLIAHEGVVHYLHRGRPVVDDPLDFPCDCGAVLNPYDCAEVPRGAVAAGEMSVCEECREGAEHMREFVEVRPELKLEPAELVMARDDATDLIHAGAQTPAGIREQVAMKVKGPLDAATRARLVTDAQPLMWVCLRDAALALRRPKGEPQLRQLAFPNTERQLFALARQAARVFDGDLARRCTTRALLAEPAYEDDEQFQRFWQRRMEHFRQTLWAGLRERDVDLDGPE